MSIAKDILRQLGVVGDDIESAAGFVTMVLHNLISLK